MRKNFKNIIISLFVITSIIVMPFGVIKKASAQSISGGVTGSASSIITGLAPTILQFPGCKKNARKAEISSLFTEEDTQGNAAIAEGDTNYFLGLGNSNLEAEGQSATAEVNSVPTNDANTMKELIAHGQKLDTLLNKTADIKQSTGSMDKNDNCMNAIGKAVVKVLIQKLTLSIIDWINGVNSDGPLFVTNPSKFFKDIAKNEILSFGLEINDPNKFPFGKAFLINEANKFNQHFADNAQYSLNEMIQKTTPEYTAASFSADFSAGGWGAWDALTQVPYNNPLGFNLEASNELQKRLAGTSQSVAQNVRDSLQQAGGFLGDERCADPKNLKMEEHERALKGEEGARLCKRWEYVTPGKVISEKLTSAVGYNDHALLDAETLNDAIAAILDTVMAKFTSNLMEKGIMALSENNDTSSDQTDLLGDLFNQTDTPNTGTQFASSYMTPWLQNNPDFNINTDITQAFIDEQRTYLNKLDSYNKALTDLIKWIRQLDYCIPGPNPDYDATASDIINSIGGPGKTGGAWWDRGFRTFMVSTFGSLDPTGITRMFDGLATEDKVKKTREAFANYLGNIVGVTINPLQTQVNSMGEAIDVLNNLLNSYKKVIDEVYFTNGKDYMPEVTLESRAEFRKITGYEQIIGNNTEEITFKKSIIKRLEDFKKKIDSGEITSMELNDSSSQAINEFARLSSYFVSGDDVANIDNLYKQAIEEKNYVKNNLVSGDFGCEKDMLDLWKNDKATYNKYAGRQPYPFELDHAYGTVASGLGSNPPSYNLSWNTNPTNEGFLWGSVYYNGHAGPFNIPSGGLCNGWIGVVKLTAGGNGDDIGISGNNVCGVVLNFERNFAIY